MDYWRKRVSPADKRKYKEIQGVINDTIDSLDSFSEEELKIAAKAVQRLKNELLKIEFKYDFKKFIDFFFSGKEEFSLQDKVETPDFHLEMFEAFESDARVCVIAPRGHAKSTLSRLYMLHKILYSQVRFIIVIGSSEDLAAQNVRWVRDQLTDNHKVIEVYGDLYNKKKWSETEFITSTKILVRAVGAGGKLRGQNDKGRPDLVYIDDIEDDEAVLNKDRRDKLRNWFKEAVLPIKSKTGRFIMTGTVLDNDGLLKNVANNKVKDHIKWKVLFYQAINTDDNGKRFALWEEMKPLHELEIIEREDPETFAKEYQNDPRAGTMAVFKTGWYRKFPKDSISIFNAEVSVATEKLSIMTHTDFAVSERTGADYSVVMITGMDRNSNLYVLDYYRWRTSDPHEMIDIMLNMSKKWHSDIVTIEKIAFQQLLFRVLEQEMDRRGHILAIEEMPRSGTNKLARIKSLAAPIKLGQVFWLEEHNELEEELNGITVLKTGRHDDIVDCLADAWEKQVEFMIDEQDSFAEVNTYKWLIENDLIPTVDEDLYW